MNRQIIFRADGNAYIGAGHIMRCLSIGMAAHNMSVQCTFITADSSFSQIIKDYGFENIVLGTDYTNMQSELPTLSPILSKLHPDIIFVDSYYVTDKYFGEIGKHAKVAYIDDMMSFPYPVDFLINYNAFASQLNYPEYYSQNDTPLPNFLLGEKFVPLRNEFQELAEIPVRKQAQDILFTAGGADPDRIALQFINAVLVDNRLAKYNFHLVLGSYEPDIDTITELAKHNNNLHIYQNVRKMANLMRQCDLAVSAAGSTIYELCSCGIPTITYILEDNQVLGANSLSRKNVVINAGDVRTKVNFFSDLCTLINNVAQSLEVRESMHNAALQTVDGNGASNIIADIFEDDHFY